MRIFYFFLILSGAEIASKSYQPVLKSLLKTVNSLQWKRLLKFRAMQKSIRMRKPGVNFRQLENRKMNIFQSKFFKTKKTQMIRLELQNAIDRKKE